MNASTTLRSVFLATVALGPLPAQPILAATTENADRIQPWTEDTRYWQYHGKPVLLLGGSQTDHLFLLDDLKPHLEEMVSVGANAVRNTMSQREEIQRKAHRLLENDKFDLDQWNPEYWERFENCLRWTFERDIIMQIEVWDRFDYSQEQWSHSPWNPTNNVNYSSAQSGLAHGYPAPAWRDRHPFFHTIPGMAGYQTKYDLLREHQERFVAKMLAHGLRYPHVLYCMNNETSTDPAWGRYWMRFIKAKAGAVGAEVYVTDMFDDAYLAGGSGIYVLYFTDGGEVTVDLSAERSKLNLHWVDITTGEWGPKATLNAGEAVQISAPGPKGWAAAITGADVDRQSATGSPREIHVAKSGNDTGTGDRADPYRTIGTAASAAQAGDTIIVHAGTYRERVIPTRGGTGEDRRIVYRAAPGEDVFIKGSERITTWQEEDGGLWKAELPNSFFGDYNPYALELSGGWLNYGKWHHRGDVYLNGDAFFERQTPAEVRQTMQSWHARVDENITTILASFGDADPNRELVEINVRESLFMPQTSGLRYITVAGFHFLHSADNWAPPTLELQMGAVGTRMGKNWIIENCTIVNARCVGIILGHAPGVDYGDIDAYGDHVVRNNIIRRCGQAGIAGQKGATRSLITGNLIEDTNYRREFGGWETAAIKFHNSVDTVIEGNLIRGVYHQEQGAFGIWIDYGNQGTRINRNIIYDTQAATVFLEMNHGPALVDHNILIGHEIRSNSEATVFAHNLLVDCPYTFSPDLERRSQYYEPHTTKVVGREPGTAQDDKWFNNIFVRIGLDGVKKAPGYESDTNVFLEGARKSTFGDQRSIVDGFKTGIRVESQPLGATITLSFNETPLSIQAPRVDAALVGVFTTVGQTIEDRDGRPISVDTDINGTTFSRPLPGPLTNLRTGRNTVVWSFDSADSSNR